MKRSDRASIIAFIFLILTIIFGYFSIFLFFDLKMIIAACFSAFWFFMFGYTAKSFEKEAAEEKKSDS